MSTPPTSFLLPFVKKEQLTKDAFSFYFDRKAFAFDFLPGQYIRMILPNENPDDRGTSRFFTIAASPFNKDFLIVTTRIGRSTFKQQLAKLTEGQEVQFWGPIGRFVLQEDAQNSLVFLAGGIGITPFYSMISYAAEKKLSIPLTLFVSFSVPEEIIYYEELTRIAQNSSSIQIVYTVTHADESSVTWSGERGRISEDLLKKYIPNIQTSTYYITGPGPMVDGTKEMLTALHIPEEQILIEKFPGY